MRMYIVEMACKHLKSLSWSCRDRLNNLKVRKALLTSGRQTYYVFFTVITLSLPIFRAVSRYHTLCVDDKACTGKLLLDLGDCVLEPSRALQDFSREAATSTTAKRTTVDLELDDVSKLWERGTGS